MQNSHKINLLKKKTLYMYILSIQHLRAMPVSTTIYIIIIIYYYYNYYIIIIIYNNYNYNYNIIL